MKSLEDLLSMRESAHFEIKEAQGRDGDGKLPGSFWKTYSAMANTEGGYVLLGAREDDNDNLVPLPAFDFRWNSRLSGGLSGAAGRGNGLSLAVPPDI